MRIGVLTTALSVAVGLALADPAAAAIKTRTNIEPQGLGSALREFAADRHLQILYTTDTVANRQTPGAVGELTVTETLTRLLGGTGLVFRYIDENTITIMSLDDVGPASPTQKATGAQGEGSTPSEPSKTTGEKTADSRQTIELLEIVVTGSRLRVPTVTSPVTVIDRETIEERGFTTAEDVIRSLPQNFSTMNAARSVTQPVGGNGLPVGPAAQGEVSANLRGLGQSATLVLIDGRRTAGSAAFAGASVNLASIPVAAIERIEVLSDSAAAVYGSDAIAGVINIVMRKDFDGASSSIRYEDGSNGGDKRAFDQVLGLGWGSGNVTATVSASETQPILSRNIGFTSRDMRSLGGYDARSGLFAQPGNVLGQGSLPPGSDGNTWTAGDLSQANFQLARADLVPGEQSSHNRTGALYISARQTLSERIEGFTNLHYSRTKVEAEGGAPCMAAFMSPTNPYNRLGTTALAAYCAQNEHDAGLIPHSFSANDLQHRSIDAGLRIELPVRDWRADVSAVHSDSRSESHDESYPNSFLFFNPTVGATVNLFGDGSSQNVQPFLDAFGPIANTTARKTMLDGFTSSVEGSLLDFSTGSMRGAFGGEYRVEKLDFGANDYIAITDLSDLSPKQTVKAVFAETSIPLLPRVTATVQGRWEQYETSSSDPTIDGKTFDQTSPRVGLAWKATPDFTLRGTWGKSFKAPNLTNLVVASSIGQFPDDEFDPIQNETVPVFTDSISNRELKPETGETTTVGFDWHPVALRGTELSVTYNRTDFSNQIVGSHFVLGGLSTEDLLANPEAFPGFAVRDPQTNTLLRLQAFPINVARVVVEAIDVNMRWQGDFAWGQFNSTLMGTYTLKLDEQAAAILPTSELVGTWNADRFVGLFSLGWKRGSFGADLYGNYVGSYSNTVIGVGVPGGQDIPPQRVDSRTTWDLTAYYQFPAGWRVAGGARNLFDEEFPFVQNPAGPFDTKRVDLRGRILQLELRKDFSF